MAFSKSALFVVSLLLSSVSAFPAAGPNGVKGKLEKRDSVFSPPYYPSPKGGWTPDWQASYAKAQNIVSQMTLVEKVNLTTGTGLYMGPCSGNTGSVPRFGIPNLCLQDSALGVAKTDHNTAFPAGITVGATFDKDLMYARGVAMGTEFRGKGVNIQLGPTIGPLGRSPYAGRNWEGFGADPYLQGIGGAQTIRGIQSQGVIATAKHFIANEQEQHRMDIHIQPAISSDIDDRTLHELYIWPFAEAIRAGVGAVMMAYNEVNDSACSQNAYLMNGILKNELGFQGFTMSDWLAQISGVASALAGLDMSMPGDGYIPLTGTSYWAYELTTAVLNSSVPVDRLNDMATRIVAAWYQMGQNSGFPLPNFSSNTGAQTGPLYPGALFSPSGVVNQFVNVQADHANIVREIGRDAITLLKNDNNILPLKITTSIRIYGDDAGSNPNGPNSCADKACDSGVLGMGWGSGTANYPYLVAPVDAIRAKSSNLQSASISDSFPSGQTAGPNDVALVFITADSGENQDTVEGNPGDRNNLNAWHNGDELVQDAAKIYQNVVVIVHTVGPIIMDNWINLPSVKAVLFAHLPGQEAGNSLVDILFGDYSPSGHLPYTIPKSENDVSVFKPVGFNWGQIHSPFSEGLYIDYRYFNKKGITPRYPFGYGLSYTTFSFSASIAQGATSLSTLPPTPPSKGPVPAYSTAIPPASEAAWPKNFNKIWRYLYPYLDNPQSVKVGKYNYPAGYSTTEQPLSAAGGAQGGNPALWDQMYSVSVNVTNTGSVAGKAVAQLYLTFPTGIPYDTPVIQLRDFGKTAILQPGQSATLTLSLTRKDLSVWDVVQQNWVLPGAASGVDGYTVSIGDSSINLPVKCNTVTLTC